MRCPTLSELPPPPLGKTGWPWTEEAPHLLDTMPDGTPGPRISIVTPSYNQGQFLEEAMRSVLLQGYPNLEYIIIDGGSTDNSVEVVQKYKPWLAYWVSEPDRGQSHAINKGFARCTGDIITFFGSDDVYLPGTFADVGTRWPQWQGYGAIVGSFYYLDEQSRLDEEPCLPRLPHEGPIDLTLGPPGIYRLHQVSTFYTRQALDDVGRWVREDLKYTMDRELLYRVCREHKVFLVDRAYGAFRKHNESKSFSAILPFSREFAELYLLHLSGNKAEDCLRIRMSRHHQAHGYMKYAKATDSILSAAAALMIVLVYKPDYILQRSYLATWLDVLHLRVFLKSLRTTKARLV
jgi:glycosyltransferase involved in cell wall biosynthesis